MDNEIFSLYDKINTIAVRWLTYNSKTHKQKLCINFKKQVNYYWFLHMLESFRVFNNYVEYYIDCGIIRFLILKYINKFKGAKKYNKKIDVLKIDVEIFINDLIEFFKFNGEKVQDSKIIEQIYDAYWKDGD